MQLIDKNVLVTGANRGIGAALVDALLEAGARRVYAAVRRRGSVDAASERVVELVLDVRDPAACLRAASQASDVDVVINNAGTLSAFGLLDAPVDALETDFGTNFYGTLHMARAFVPVLRTRPEAAIVNVLTMLSVASLPAMGGYSASKAAAWSLTQALRAELTPEIAVHGVYPGAVDTDMIRDVDMPKTAPSEVAAAIVVGLRNGDEDIAPDPMSAQLWELFTSDPKAVERTFASM